MNFDYPEDTARAGIEAFRQFLKKIQMPSNLKELGGREEDIEELAYKCCYGNGRTGTVNGFATLTEQDVINIFHLMV